MDLVFEIVSALQSVPAVPAGKTFRQAGGVIGRHADCDWVIHDPTNELSKQHATISYRDGAYYLTDISTNGTQLMDDGAQLGKGAPHRIANGNVFRLATFLIRARLVESQARADHASAAPALIPDDAFLDPLSAIGLANGVRLGGETSEAPVQPADHTRVEIGNLPLPVLVPESQPAAATPSPQPADRFWQNFASELGLDLDELDDNARQALALKTAHLLRQCIGGLQQTGRCATAAMPRCRTAWPGTSPACWNNPSATR
ncbi:type VI secretion system protein ImpI [Pseudomonas knackmussii B13]|uniref:Type VI secretion system protein ImpI n=1 Tax=Pseudomonas knackmussii (strain DSM 6978 / CCUG 54928 / LMG 23759 / B13) TaxID=1301098 RepID=A0A024HGU5_PSEKB|nr:FHA domain-containing protein [Pseudomonas knackmussii]CDF83874.1 type VI secretion system protein ImpI [Pseudomonas knackmussii B13]